MTDRHVDSPTQTTKGMEMNADAPRRGAGIMHTVLVNTSSNVFRLAVSTVITFFMTPVYLHALGQYDYGVWEIVGSLIGYLGLLDIGLRPTISRFIARVSPVTEGEQWRKVYSTSFFLMLGVGIVIGCVFLGWSVIAPDGLAEQPERAHRYALFLQLVALQVVIAFPNTGLESALEGGQRYVVKNNITMLHTIVSSVFLYHYIYRSIWDPLLLLCLVNIVAGLSKLVCFLWMLAPRGNGPKIPTPSHFDTGLAREMYGFGAKSFVQNTAGLIEQRGDVLIIGGFLGPALVVFYSIPQALLAQIRNLIWNLTHAFMPMFSKMDSQGQHDRVKTYFFAGSRLMVGILTLFFIGAVTLGGPFISLWVGEKYISGNKIILYILAGYIYVGMMFPLGGRYMTAVGRHGALAKVGSIRALINLGISLALVLPLGLAGVALGSLLATLVIFPMEARAILGCLDMGLGSYLRSTLLPAVVPALAMSLLAVGGNVLGWTQNWLGFLLTGTIASLAFVLLYLVFGLRPEDRTRFIRLFGAA
jgi:O-antigen/teichoic acid export membrane protein